MQKEQSGRGLGNRALVIINLLAVTAVFGLLLATLFVRVNNLQTQQVRLEDAAEQLDRDAQIILERAADSLNAVDLVLSFLEGASVLIGLGFGAAALYGLRSTQETRDEFNAEVERIEGLREKLETELGELRKYAPYLEDLADLRQEQQRSNENLGQTIDNVARLLQADQEFRLKNFETAYQIAHRVLDLDPDDPMALYIAGWLEVQHMRDKLDEGIDHLRHVAELEPEWATAKAAYGVGLRRKARKSEGMARERLYLEAEGVLKEALAQNPRLMDFEGESFWGPVGGIQRDRGEIDAAINSYRNALEVTPGSSYPAGNLAGLSLMRAKATGEPARYEEALNAFDQTVRAARGELAFKPNDYYLLMDVAQALTMLGRRDAANFDEALRMLEQALAAEVSTNALETSLSGWQSLADNCPAEWTDVRGAVARAISTVESAIAALRQDAPAVE